MTPGDSNKREASASSSRIDREATQLSSFISDKKKKTVSWANNATYKYVECVDPTDSFVSDNGHDSLQVIVPEEVAGNDAAMFLEKHTPDRKGQFMQKLMNVLSDDTLSNVVTWLPHGRAFIILRPDIFSDIVLPHVFSTSDEQQQPISSSTANKNVPNSNARRYRNFLRKLTACGFHQVSQGQDSGAYYNPIFIRDQPELFLEESKMAPPPPRIGYLDSSSDAQSSLVANSNPQVSPPKQLTEPVKSMLMVQEGVVSSHGVPLLPSPYSISSPPSSPGSIFLLDAGLIERNNANRANQASRNFMNQMLSNALRKRDEEEVLRAARAMLYANFLQALQASA